MDKTYDILRNRILNLAARGALGLEQGISVKVNLRADICRNSEDAVDLYIYTQDDRGHYPHDETAQLLDSWGDESGNYHANGGRDGYHYLSEVPGPMWRAAVAETMTQPHNLTRKCIYCNKSMPVGGSSSHDECAQREVRRRPLVATYNA